MSMSINFTFGGIELNRHGGQIQGIGLITGHGNDGIGDFDIGGQYFLSADKRFFHLTFEKIYIGAHTIHYTATIGINKPTSMSGFWNFVKTATTGDHFSLNKVSGKLNSYNAMFLEHLFIPMYETI